MYNKKLVEEFWSTFGKYMSLQPGANGAKVNWINYKTGIRYVQFKLFADDKTASLTVELSNPDPGVQQMLFTQIMNDRQMLESFTNEKWIWTPSVVTGGGNIISLFSQELREVNVYVKSDWPAIISFFKPLLTGLDLFWSEQKDFYMMIAG
ncbi:MAG: DUF4268 domain-containing protein [Chitinophagaceae bacterium]|nr:MAG: DUF4268 domain-containing protein [Chitinophagaceae bacterium]